MAASSPSGSAPRARRWGASSGSTRSPRAGSRSLRRLGRERQLRRGLEQLDPAGAVTASSASGSAPPARRSGAEFRVNAFTTDDQNDPPSPRTRTATSSWPGTASARTGAVSASSASGSAPRARRWGPSSGSTRSPRAGSAIPAVASDASGDFVVAWAGCGQDGSAKASSASGSSAAGAPLGGEFRVNTFTPAGQSMPSVASDANGNFVVAWSSYVQDGIARRLRPAVQRRGRAAGDRVPGQHAHTSASELAPPSPRTRLATSSSPGAASARTGAVTGVFGQRFGGLASGRAGRRHGRPSPRRRQRRAGAGRVHRRAARPGATSTGAAQAFGGVFSDIAGPAGRPLRHLRSRRRLRHGGRRRRPAPVIDCYGVAVSSPAMRPVAALGRERPGDDRARRARADEELAAAHRRQLYGRAACATPSTASSRRCCTTA